MHRYPYHESKNESGQSELRVRISLSAFSLLYLKSYETTMLEQCLALLFVLHWDMRHDYPAQPKSTGVPAISCLERTK